MELPLGREIIMEGEKTSKCCCLTRKLTWKKGGKMVKSVDHGKFFFIFFECCPGLADHEYAIISWKSRRGRGRGGHPIHLCTWSFTRSVAAVQRVSHERSPNESSYRQTDIGFNKETHDGESEKLEMDDVTWPWRGQIAVSKWLHVCNIGIETGYRLAIGSHAVYNCMTWNLAT